MPSNTPLDFNVWVNLSCICKVIKNPNQFVTINVVLLGAERLVRYPKVFSNRRRPLLERRGQQILELIINQGNLFLQYIK